MTIVRRSFAPFLCAFLMSTVHAADDPTTSGQKISMQGTSGVPACATCHGAKGEGNGAAGFPRLAGLGATYLDKQLTDIADGIRPSPVMASIATALSPSDRQAVALYYSQLASPYDIEKLAATADIDPSETNRGAWLAIRGAWEKNLPACNQCHGPGGIGVGDSFPALAGQPKNYLSAQLSAWQTGKRSPLPLGLMPAVATKMTAQEIDAVATYYSELPATAHAQSGAKP